MFTSVLTMLLPLVPMLLLLFAVGLVLRVLGNFLSKRFHLDDQQDHRASVENRHLQTAGEEFDFSKYKKKSIILSTAEQTHFSALQAAYGEQYYIFCQVGLRAVIELEPDTWEFKYGNSLRKILDFVLVNKQTFAVEKVIELNDYTHQKANRVVRDEFIQKLFTQCDIPFEEHWEAGKLSEPLSSAT